MTRLVTAPAGRLGSCNREGLEELRHLEANAELGAVVVIAVGTHDALSMPVADLPARLAQVRSIIGTRPLLLVAVAAAPGNEQRLMRRYNRTAARWCSDDGNCNVIDWDRQPLARRASSYRADRIQLTRRGHSARSAYIAERTHRLLPPGGPSPEPPDTPFGPGVVTSGDGERGVARDGVGAFRIVCPYTHSAADDPIVRPRQPGAAHLHSFFANRSVDAFTTDESLLRGSSSCPGGTANLSGYWVPSMVGPTGEVRPRELVAYYKSGYGGIAAGDVRAIPRGLRIIAGEPMRTTADSRPSWQRHVFWSCVRLPDGEFTENSAEMQPCPAGWNVLMSVQFPQCWDGANLDSADHISHMAYPDGGCPLSHPVPIPAITLNIYWPVATSTTGWRLASDMYEGPSGRSGHADWWNGWDPGVVDVWMYHCVNAGLDCGASNLGDGRRLS